MSWLGLILVVVGIVLAIKLVGALLRIAMVGLVVVGLWIVLAPFLGLPSPF